MFTTRFINRLIFCIFLGVCMWVYVKYLTSAILIATAWILATEQSSLACKDQIMNSLSPDGKTVRQSSLTILCEKAKKRPGFSSCAKAAKISVDQGKRAYHNDDYERAIRLFDEFFF